MMNFFRKYFSELILLLIILAVLIFSLSTLTTKPRLWTDEGLSIELARNFLLYGRLDVLVAPDAFSGVPFLLQSTGYPMTIALAMFFKLFGLGLAQARLFALGLMIILLVLVYLFAKKQFGQVQAFLAVSLIATFASFYGSGRCITGEILGFIFLIVGLSYFLDRHQLWLSGLFFGLAVVTKPSIYLLIVPATLMVFLIDWRSFCTKFIRLGAGLAPAIAIWIWLNVPGYFLAGTWWAILNFYKNPFGQTSVIGNILSNLISWPYSTTLIYFSVLFLIILWAIFWDKKLIESKKELFIFVLAYIFLSFLYFLKSPGWLRYLLASQFIIFIVLSPAIGSLVNGLGIRHPNLFSGGKKRFFYGSIIFLILVQLVHLNTKADLFYSTASIDAINFLNQKGSSKAVGLINSVEVGGLILSEKKYQFIDNFLGFPTLGHDFLASSPPLLPELVVSDPSQGLLDRHRDVIAEFYELVFNNGKYYIYARK